MRKQSSRKPPNNSRILGSIIAEVIDRRRDGEVPQVSEYIARYPSLREAIEAGFSTVELLEGSFPEAAEAPGSSHPLEAGAGDHLGEAIAALPQQLQQVIFLRNFRNRSWQDIALEIGRPEGELRREYARAIQALLTSGSR